MERGCQRAWVGSTPPLRLVTPLLGLGRLHELERRDFPLPPVSPLRSHAPNDPDVLDRPSVPLSYDMTERLGGAHGRFVVAVGDVHVSLGEPGEVGHFYDSPRLPSLLVGDAFPSRQGDGLDHAVAERCFGRVKGEGTSLHHDARRQEAREEVIDSIEMFTNSQRLPSYLGYVSPHAFEDLTQSASLSVRFYLTTTTAGKLSLAQRRS